MIYFDNAATTQPYKEVVDTFFEASLNKFYNPSASYLPSFNLFKEINGYRKQIIECLGGDKELDNVIFTSGATESDNLAVFGTCFNKHKKYLFSVGEHPAIYNSAMELKNRGYNVEFISLQKNGQIDYDDLEKKCDKEVCFVSIMSVNNETGAINNLEKVREIIDKKTENCVFHVDAVQGFCKININVKKCKINLLSISGHKIHGLKGIGALYISKGTRLKNINYGGGQEFNLRSGTVNYPAICALTRAIEISFKNKDENYLKVLDLKNYLTEKLKSLKSNVIVASDSNCSPYIVSLIFEGNRGETIMRYLDSKNILVGTGSACSSSKVGNRVLENMKYTQRQILGSIRISFCAKNTKDEIDKLVKELQNYFTNVNA